MSYLKPKLHLIKKLHYVETVFLRILEKRKKKVIMWKCIMLLVKRKLNNLKKNILIYAINEKICHFTQSYFEFGYRPVCECPVYRAQDTLNIGPF